MKKLFSKIGAWIARRWKEFMTIRHDRKQMKIEREVKKVEFTKKHPMYTIITRILCVGFVLSLVFGYFMVAYKTMKVIDTPIEPISTVETETNSVSYTSSVSDGVSATSFEDEWTSNLICFDIPVMFSVWDTEDVCDGPYYPAAYFDTLVFDTNTMTIVGGIGYSTYIMQSDMYPITSDSNSLQLNCFAQTYDGSKGNGCYWYDPIECYISGGPGDFDFKTNFGDYHLQSMACIYAHNIVETDLFGPYKAAFNIRLFFSVANSNRLSSTYEFSYVISCPYTYDEREYGIGGFAHDFTREIIPYGYGKALFNYSNRLGFDKGRDDGFSAGENMGDEEAYMDGWEVGYRQGYNNGLDETLEDVTPWHVIVSGVNAFFGLSPFGNGVNMGVILSIGFGMLLLGFAIKMFLGG